MSYTDFVATTPAATQTPGNALTSTRQNLLALRDWVISIGSLPGWDAEAQDSDGSTPPTDPTAPEQIVYSNGSERIKVVLSYSDGLVTRVVTSYSSDSGSSYDVITGGSTNGYFNLTYDASDNWLSASWS